VWYRSRMLGLRPWHKKLLLSEAIAAAIVLYGYSALTSQAGGFWQLLASAVTGTALLLPGLWLLRPGPADSLAPACLVTAAVYTLGIFALLSLSSALLKRILARAGSVSELEHNDSRRYLR